MTSTPLRLFLTIATMILGTWIIGWTAVPLVAFVCGIVSVAPRVVALSAGMAWALLLLADIASVSFARLVGMLAGIMGLPGAVLLLMTVVFPMVLAWSAATVGTGLRSILFLADAGPG